MTDKQNYFTYTDNTSDDNDKTMENLHKQIIMDGVDVSECGYYVSNGECTNENVYPDYCKVCSNCTYKLEQQLKVKEQECERLKKQYNCYACDTCKGKEDYINLKRHCENAIKSLHNKQAELDQLKAENEELTTINARLLGRLEVDETDASLVFNLDKELRQKEKEFYTAIQKVVKLKQTLRNIKEIAEDAKTKVFVDMEEFWKQILQKISESEVNNG